MSLKLLILGGGLMGRLCALALSAPGFWPQPVTIRLLQRDQFTPLPRAGFEPTAAYAAAAMISPLAESVLLDEQLVALGYRSMHLWQQLQQQMPDFGFAQQGALLLAHPQQQGLLRHLVSQIKPQHEFLPQWLNQAELSALEPSLATRFSQGCFLPGEAQLDNLAFLQASLALLQQRGVSLEAGVAATVLEGKVWCHGKQQAADLIIDCRGLGAQAELPTLRPVRGEVLRVQAKSVQISRPVRLCHPRYALYVAPKGQGNFVVGATEIESSDQSGPSVRASLELLSALYALDPGFADAEVTSVQASARPALPDNKPKISCAAGVISVNGLYRHGYLLGPAFAEQVAVLAQQVLLTTEPSAVLKAGAKAGPKIATDLARQSMVHAAPLEVCHGE
jgi:glycine oxidase